MSKAFGIPCYEADSAKVHFLGCSGRAVPAALCDELSVLDVESKLCYVRKNNRKE